MDGPNARPAPVSPSVPAIDRTRALVARVVPRGAIVLSLLSLGYFAAGIVRNRVFAAEFGISA